MKKITRHITSLLLCAVVYLSCYPTSASASTRSVISFMATVTPIRQQADTWCWAACAEMCGKTIDPTSTRTQADVVNYVDSDLAETIDGIIKGCEYVANFKKSFTYDFISSTLLYRKASQKEATVVLAYPKNGTMYDPGHTLLVYGIVSTSSEGVTKRDVYYVDPWDGKRYSCDYEKFCDGTSNNLWKPIMVVYSDGEGGVV